MSNQAENTTNQDPVRAEHETPPATEQDAAATGDDEFQITIRKLEMPVRPRGVLAE